jgi:hypothetical protein
MDTRSSRFRKNRETNWTTQNHEEQGKEERFLPLLGHIFQTEMPQLHKLSIFKWILIKVLMGAVLISSAAYTIHIGSSLITNYLQYPTTSSLTVWFNKSFQLPTTSFCLPMATFWFDDRLAANSNPITGNTSSYTYYQDQVKTYFALENVTKARFLNAGKSDKTWPNPIYSVAINYITILTYGESFDNLEANSGSSFRFSRDFPDLTYLTIYYGDGWQAAMELERHIFALNISFDELRQAVGRTFGTLINLNLSHNEETNGLTSVRSIDLSHLQTSYLSYWWVCYVVDFASLNIGLKSSGEYIQIAVDGTSLKIDPDSIYL